MEINFDPVAFWLGPIPLRWYGLMYVFGFLFFLMLGRKKIQQSNKKTNFTLTDLDDLILFAVAGVFIGGRLGYVFFYNPGYFSQNPSEIFFVWQGGMSFHGGLVGVIFGLALFCFLRKNLFFEGSLTRRFLCLTDFVAPLVPPGLFFGRIGNFINGELPGRVTSIEQVPWAMIFPHSGTLDFRHPSQLYQAFGEGVVLFIILLIAEKKKKGLGTVSATFLISYGIIRFFTEFFREPDPFIGLLIFDFSMGQLLSFPLVGCGLVLLFLSLNYKKIRHQNRSS
mgnify:CR=1 FL=1|tara:strand:+ start:2079 stop:2921 length:843 start_codon:yes stop_codon:yes gene_type:complete